MPWNLRFAEESSTVGRLGFTTCIIQECFSSRFLLCWFVMFSGSMVSLICLSMFRMWPSRLIEHTGRFSSPSGGQVKLVCRRWWNLVLGPLFGSIYSPESDFQSIAVFPSLISLCQC